MPVYYIATSVRDQNHDICTRGSRTLGGEEEEEEIRKGGIIDNEVWTNTLRRQKYKRSSSHYILEKYLKKDNDDGLMQAYRCSLAALGARRPLLR